MPKFEITAPDGRVFEVDGPEGATAEQALAQVQAQYKPSSMVDTALQKLKSAVAMTPPGMVFRGLEALEQAKEPIGGLVVDTAARLGAPPEVSAALGTATKMAPDMLIGGGFGGTVGRAATDIAAKRVMQSALKPNSKSLANGDAARAIQTMLNEGISATAAGALKLRHLITKLKGEAGKALSQADGTLVDKAHVYRELSSTLDDVTKQGTPDAAIAAVKKAMDQFDNHPLLKGADKIPVQLADDIKRGTQKAVKDSTTPVDEQAQKAIASGLRQGIEEAVPAVAPINATLSKYINALHQIEPKAAIQANKDLGGLVPLAHSPEAMMLMLADRNPWMKSAIARVLYGDRLRGALPAATGTAAVAGQQ